MSSHGNNKFIVFDNVSKSYHDVQALDAVSFEIDEGEVFGYIGPNGAGKTTTIKIMVGLLTDFRGSYSMMGHKIPERITEVQKLFGYMPQTTAFQEWRTVDQALQTFGKLSGVRRKIREDKIKELLTLLNIASVRHKKINKLSGGMTQKVGLVQALLHSPKLLVLDEPLSGLDPESRYQFKDIIKNLSKNGTTVFFSSHILSDVQDVATKIGIINKGRILKTGTLDELKNDFLTTHTIEVRISKPADELNELNTLQGIKSVEKSGTLKILVHIDDNENINEMCDKIIKRLIELGCRVGSFMPVTPNLDEVYLKYIEGDKSS